MSAASRTGTVRRIAWTTARAAQPRTWRWLWRRWRASSFLEFYAQCVNEHAAVDPIEATGGRWDEIGALQFEFLRREGLRPEHVMLDVGCGALRGGRHYIKYLDRAGYFGVDISSVVLDAARRVVADEQLTNKAPTLRLVADTAFDWFGDRVFDVILAQSVLTHMRPPDLAGMFANVPRVMGPKTVFYATCFVGRDTVWRRLTTTTFAYPLELFTELGNRNGLDVTALAGAEYPHPYGTRMLRITRRPPSLGRL